MNAWVCDRCGKIGSDCKCGGKQMKSSFSNPNGACIEVFKNQDADVFINEVKSKDLFITETDPNLNIGRITTSKENFKAFIEGVKAGEFDHFVEDI